MTSMGVDQQFFIDELFGQRAIKRLSCLFSVHSRLHDCEGQFMDQVRLIVNNIWQYVGRVNYKF